ncbi:MAG: radical SAM protein [Candidatus Omnitrophica bacterium]|nr:radical SAM protein [Candidatus Omnitrophota bacterium]
MAQPSYLDNLKQLKKAAKQAASLLKSCRICPRGCKVNRLRNETGFCRTGLNARVFSYMPHRGEEPAISGSRGSGTIFFSGCNLRCAYCQNYEFSQSARGSEAEPRKLAKYMLYLQKLGCHNINFVTPTHVLPQILSALTVAIEEGLNIPLVYNSSGYEFSEMIELLDGIIDIYLPDMRYADDKAALKYSSAPDYPLINRSAVKEMFRQVGVGVFDEEGIIQRGMIIRHLVLPQGQAGSEEIFRFISEELSQDVYISLMSQYFPCYNAEEFPEINRRPALEEYEQARRAMEKRGLHNGWAQESGGLQRFAGVNIKRNTE